MPEFDRHDYANEVNDQKYALAIRQIESSSSSYGVPATTPAFVYTSDLVARPDEAVWDEKAAC
jgi:hypothetical protein